MLKSEGEIGHGPVLSGTAEGLSPATGAALDLRGIKKSYPGVAALKGVDFNVQPGEVHILLGENGAGKSTLIKIIAGAEQRDWGDLSIAGQRIERVNPAQMRNLGVSVIYQELSLVPKMDLVSNIFLGREKVVDYFIGRLLGWRNRRAMESFCRKVLDDLEIDIPIDSVIADLSVSDMQLVEIARAVAFNARIILMDEPTTSLGPPEKERLFSIIAKLKARGIGIVYVSHILEDCLMLGDRITVLRDGAHISTVSRGAVDVDGLVELMTGRSFTERYPRIASSPGRKALEIRNLTLKGKFEDVSFDVHEGEIIGFSGLVGAGRTDVMHAIFGLEPADSGEIRVFGKAVSIRQPRDAISNGISLLTENRKSIGILPNLSIRDNIVVTVLNLKTSTLTDGLVRLRQFLRFDRIDAYVRRLIKEIQIKAASPDSLIVELSGGNQQKVLLARAVSAEAQIVILDEPTKGVDAGAKVEIYRMLQRLVEQKLAVIVVSSELPEVFAVANKIVVMKQGRVTALVDRASTSAEQVSRHATI